MNYILNLLKAYGQISPSTSPLALKRMLLRGREFDGITVLANVEEIGHSLLGNDSAKEDVKDKQRKLKFELQMKERELERVESLGADNSSVPAIRMEQMKNTIKKLSSELQQLEKGVTTQSVPQVDYLKTCYDFYIQHNQYHLSDIDFSDCVKSIPFYDLKHFFQDVIKGIYVESREIKAIEFRTEQEKSILHQFHR